MNKEWTGYPSTDKPWLKYYPKDVVGYVNRTENQNAYQYLCNACKNNLDYIALDYFGRDISYLELLEHIEETAKALTAHGIVRGDYITVCLPNIPEIVYFIYAINKIGAVVCLIDPRTNAENILHRANESCSKILITITDIINEKINPIADKLVAEKIVDVSPAYSAKSFFVKAAYTFKQPHYKSNKFMSLKVFYQKGTYVSTGNDTYSKNAPAIIIYTSGTTGDSKGIVLTNENLIASRKLSEFGATRINYNAVFLGVIPFFVAYGAVTGMNNSLCSGWKIIMIPKYNPKDFGKMVMKYKVECVIGVPRFWETFAIDNKSADLSKLKNPVCGGDKIAPPALERVNQYLNANGSSRLKVGYGASEFGGGIVITTDYGPYEEGSVGEILPGVIGMVIDPDTGEELGYDKDGELCFHSPSMMCGYFNRDKETDKISVYKDGIKFYRTGDKGHISKNGTVYIIDRYKRIMIRPDGHTVNASPIENVIMSHKSVDSCAVVGIPFDEKTGVIPTAFIVLREEVSSSPKLIQEIDQLCQIKLPARDKTQAYVVVSKLPYTPMGKVDYRNLESNKLSELECTITDYSFLDLKT